MDKRYFDLDDKNITIRKKKSYTNDHILASNDSVVTVLNTEVETKKINKFFLPLALKVLDSAAFHYQNIKLNV